MPRPEMVDGKVKRILSLEGVNSSDIVALCPGTRLMTTDVVSSSVTCMESTDKTFEMGNSGDAVTFEEMSCEESIQEVIKSTDEECGPDDNPGKLTKKKLQISGSNSSLSAGPLPVGKDLLAIMLCCLAVLGRVL